MEASARSAILIALIVLALTGGNPAAQAADPRAVPSQQSISRTQGGYRAVAPAWLNQAAAVAGDSCEELLDVSDSMGDDGRRHIAEGFAPMVRLVVEAYGCRVMRVSAFSGDAPFQALLEFSLPTSDSQNVAACLRVPVASAGGMSAVAQAIYPSLREGERRKAEAQCRARLQAEMAQAATLRTARLDEMEAAIKRLARAPARGRCTGIYQAGARALQRSAHVVMVTDGAQTCQWYLQPTGAPVAFPVPGGSSMLFLLLPTTSERAAGGIDVLDREATLMSVFPGARARLLNEATPAFWRGNGATVSVNQHGAGSR